MPVLTLNNVLYMPVEELVNLPVEELQRLEREAENINWSTCKMLDWLRGIIAKKHFDARASQAIKELEESN